jgi:hypothetical protein
MRAKKVNQLSMDFDYRDEDQFPDAQGEDLDFLEKLAWQFEERFPMGTYAFSFWRPEEDGPAVFEVITSENPDKKFFDAMYFKAEGGFGFSIGEGPVRKPMYPELLKLKNKGIEVKKYLISNDRWSEFEKMNS